MPGGGSEKKTRDRSNDANRRKAQAILRKTYPISIVDGGVTVGVLVTGDARRLTGGVRERTWDYGAVGIVIEDSRVSFACPGLLKTGTRLRMFLPPWCKVFLLSSGGGAD